MDPDRQAHRVRRRGGDYFGDSVSISGNTVVVGAYDATVGGNSGQGAAYVFTEPGSGWASMTQTAKLTASDGAAGDYLGDSVSISGDTVVVGARNATVGGNSGQGAAYVFTEPDSGWVNVTETAKLTASDGAAGDNFGDSVSIDGSTLVVGADGADSSQGAAYTFLTTPVVTVTDAGGTYSAATFPATGDVTGVSGADLGTPTFTYYSGTYAAAADLTSLTALPGATDRCRPLHGPGLLRRELGLHGGQRGGQLHDRPGGLDGDGDAGLEQRDLRRAAARRDGDLGQHGNGRRGRVADGDLRGHRRHRLCVIDDGPHRSRRVPGLGQLRGQRGPHGEQQHGRLRHHAGHGHDHGHGLQRRV